MTPTDYIDQLEEQNSMLIAQSGRDEIVIQEQAETIRDLETEVERLRAKNAELVDSLSFVMSIGISKDPPTLLHRER